LGQIQDALCNDIEKSIEYSDSYKMFSRLNKSKNFIKCMLNYYRIASSDIYKTFKKDILTEKLIYIDTHLSLDQKEYLLDKIRFNKFIA
jgi:hypothetical protein